MTLHLDARQRAMLQEMGITVWGGASPGAAPTAPAPAPVSVATSGAPVAPPMAAPAAPAAPAHATPSAVRQPVRSPAAAGGLAQAPGHRPPPAAAVSGAGGDSGGGTGLVFHPLRVLYPEADPAQVPAGLGSGWLVVAECPTPSDPLAGETGKLLDNMLRAMQLHRHPRVFLAAVERSSSTADPATAGVDRLDDMLARLQPAMVLVLGHVAARAALGRSEPLGRLRAETQHHIAGFPAVVTYDAAFLLRSQDHKAAAWADLCRALAAVRG